MSLTSLQARHPTRAPRGCTGIGSFAAGLALCLLLAACSTPARTAPMDGSPTGVADSARAPMPSLAGDGAPSRRPEPASPDDAAVGARVPVVSLASYFEEDRSYNGRNLRLGRVRERTSNFVSYDATFEGDGLTISGVVNVPRGRGPHPAVVLAHGYIEPSAYVRGQGMTRERGFLADRGFVVLHVDYRAHAESDGSVREAQREVQLGYVADVINAALALADSAEIEVDRDRVGLMGRSMGGGVAYRALAAAPGVFNAAAAWASVSSREDENFDEWSRPNPAEVAYFDRAHGLPGTPRGAPFWRGVSARTHFNRVTAPILTVHGRADTTCPPRWARASHRALLANGVDSTLTWFEGEGHTFGPQFEAAMERTADFFTDAARTS